MDDLNFNLRMISNWQETHGNRSDRELDTYQMAMVYNLLVRQNPDLGKFEITHDGRVGWARKRAAAPLQDLRTRFARLINRKYNL